MDLYFAPINIFGNYVYRHIVLNNSADFVFSELIMSKHLDSNIKDRKFDIIKGDEEKTIFQIGSNNKEDIQLLISEIKKHQPKVKEVNLNCGCPHSTFYKERICSGLLLDIDFFDKVIKDFSDVCTKENLIPSIKIRIGPRPKEFWLEQYLEIAEKHNIKKVYIHARTIGHPYEKIAELEYIKNFNFSNYNIDIILNGDIDCYNKYLEIINHTNIKKQQNIKGIMIGRAALSNPLIFKQIKEHIPPRKYIGIFSPDIHDPSIHTKGLEKELSEEKKKIIYDYIKIAKENNLKDNIISPNIRYMLKGITNNKELARKILSNS